MALPCWRDSHAERQPNDRGYGPLLQVFITMSVAPIFLQEHCASPTSQQLHSRLQATPAGERVFCRSGPRSR